MIHTHVIVARTDSFGWTVSKVAQHLQRVDGSATVLHAWDYIFAASREHMQILCSFSDHYAASLAEITSKAFHLYPEAHVFRFLVERHGPVAGRAAAAGRVLAAHLMRAKTRGATRARTAACGCEGGTGGVRELALARTRRHVGSGH